MTDNEKAAIAAGLWEPEACPEHQRGAPTDCYATEPAPDMHDPANLWRALENLRQRGIRTRVEADLEQPLWGCEFRTVPDDEQIGEVGLARSVANAVFAALVALYDAEHPA